MSLGRRKASLADASAWVFNRMADVYDARPAYPVELVEAIRELAGQGAARVADLGAGIGHVALPLAALGCEVSAVEVRRQRNDKHRLEGPRESVALPNDDRSPPRLLHGPVLAQVSPPDLTTLQ